MRTQALLDALFELARERGLSVRREGMTRGVTGGGFCVLKGVPTVFVDEKGSLDAQLETLATVLRRYDWSDRELVPAVASLLARRGSSETSSKPG